MTPVYKLSNSSVKNGRTLYGSMNAGYKIPSPSTVNYLVVAGGAGGGGSQGGSYLGSGGGGAGGLRCTVTATGGGGSLESALSQ